VRQQRSVDLAVETPRLYIISNAAASAPGGWSLRRAPGDPRFVAVRVRGVVLNPGGGTASAVRARGVGRPRPISVPARQRRRARHRRAQTPGSAGLCRQFATHTTAPQPAGGHEELKEAVAVSVPTRAPGRRVGRPRPCSSAASELQTVRASAAGDAAPCAHRGERLRSRRGVLIDDVVQEKRRCLAAAGLSRAISDSLSIEISRQSAGIPPSSRLRTRLRCIMHLFSAERIDDDKCRRRKPAQTQSSAS